MTTQEQAASSKTDAAGRPRLLIEEWLPAAAIGVECIREENNPVAKPPTTYLHVWWARRPLTAARAAVLGSVLPADFPRETFEKLLGFGQSSRQLVEIRRLMDMGVRVEGGFNCDRAFKAAVDERLYEQAHAAARELWGELPTVLDPMAGGGSIPLESARLGFPTLANEYNPVACSVLEATVDYPFRFGPELAAAARKWGDVLVERITERLAPFFPRRTDGLVHAYIFARTVPCPYTGHPTPLVPDWHLLNTDKEEVVAAPVVDREGGAWAVEVKTLRHGEQPPPPTYSRGKAISLFTAEARQIDGDTIKALAQAGQMGSQLYAVAVKTPQGLTFAPPRPEDLAALAGADTELARLRPRWEREGFVPTEEYPEVSEDPRPRVYGMPRWADLFAPRQLLGFGVVVEELRLMRPEIMAAEGNDRGSAVESLLALAIDKFANFNSNLASWHAPRAVMRSVFDRHDFSFKPTFSEMAPCVAGGGLMWAINNTAKASRELSELSRAPNAVFACIQSGSATNLARVGSHSVAAVVLDPPYDDNVQYAELADFFYVWLKRMQGYRRPEWFSTYLCNRDQEAVVSHSRHRKTGEKKAQADVRARARYRELMAQTFAECHRVLRDDGVLTVMFTHKKQEAWAALFESLIEAGFTITATWPVKTESEHSLHQAQKNAAQSSVILVARKRPPDAGTGFYGPKMAAEIREVARTRAQRLAEQGLNRVDQLVGAFGPAMEVYSRYRQVKTDTGEPVGVAAALDEAADAVSQWRIEELAERGLEGVEPEGRFALLCWDVLGAAEFRFNEAKLLGHAVGMGVDQLEAVGLVEKQGDTTRILSAAQRRRDKALEPDEVVSTLFGPETVVKRRKKGDVLKVHPNDPSFRTALDGCHALALRYTEAGGGAAGIGSAQSLRRQQAWTADSAVARLMAALVKAAPPAVRVDSGAKSVAAKFPEFRAWHAMLQPLFGLEPSDWTVKGPEQMALFGDDEGGEEDVQGALESDSEGDDEA